MRLKVPTQTTQQEEEVEAGDDFLRSQPGTGSGIFLQHQGPGLSIVLGYDEQYTHSSQKAFQTWKKATRLLFR